MSQYSCCSASSARRRGGGWLDENKFFDKSQYEMLVFA